MPERTRNKVQIFTVGCDIVPELLKVNQNLNFWHFCLLFVYYPIPCEKQCERTKKGIANKRKPAECIFLSHCSLFLIDNLLIKNF